MKPRGGEKKGQVIKMDKRKIEKHYWIAFPTHEAAAEGLQLLLEGGRVHSLDFGYQIVGMTASESQLKQLKKEGIPWEFAAEVRKRMKEAEDGSKAKRQSTKPTVQADKKERQAIQMRTRKIERHFIITFLSRDDGIKGIALMKEDGLVQGMDCGASWE
jgi:hypothetical protein